MKIPKVFFFPAGVVQPTRVVPILGATSTVIGLPPVAAEVVKREFRGVHVSIDGMKVLLFHLHDDLFSKISHPRILSELLRAVRIDNASLWFIGDELFSERLALRLSKFLTKEEVYYHNPTRADSYYSIIKRFRRPREYVYELVRLQNENFMCEN